MKKNLLILAALATLSVSKSNAQNGSWYYEPGLIYSTYGASLHVGSIADDCGYNCDTKFIVAGNAAIFDGDLIFNDFDNWPPHERKIIGNANTAALGLYSQTSEADGPSIRLWGPNNPNTDQMEGITFTVSPKNPLVDNQGNVAFDFWQYGDSYPLLKLYRDGNLTALSSLNAPNINATALIKTPALNVCGLIRAKQVKIDIGTGWCDYVFEKNYNLMPIAELRDYITVNKHLPEIPAQKEVEADGAEIGEMTTKLLKKVEELTLYTIKQQEEIDALKAQVSAMSKKQ